MSYLGLLGMSGAGKSYWSKKLAAEGWQWIDWDDITYKRLGKELNCTFADRYEPGKWIGMPHEASFAAKEAFYQRLEVEVTSEIADNLEQGRFPSKTVFDFGGSVIFVGDALMQRLKQQLRLVHLQVSPDVYQQMCRVYLQKPLALIWAGQFSQNQGETLETAYTHSYPRLIETRMALCEKYAHKTLPYEWHRSPDCTVKAFLKEVKDGSNEACSVTAIL